MTITQITNISDKLDLRPYAAEFAGDYDMDAIHGQYVALLNDELPHGVGVCSNGDVIATTDVADQARDIDWTEILDSIDVAPLFEASERTGTMQTYEIRYDADGTPFAVEVSGGRVVAAAAIYTETLESMSLTSPDQVDVEDYLGDADSSEYEVAQYAASILFS